MEKNNSEIVRYRKKAWIWAGVLSFCILVYFILMKFDVVANIFKTAFDVLFPFLVGGAVAFIVNIPLRFLERRFLDKSENKFVKKYKRVISVILSILIVVAIIYLVMYLVIPNLIEALGTFVHQFPQFIEDLDKFFLSINSEAFQEVYMGFRDKLLGINIKSLSESFIGFLKTGSNASNLSSTIISFFSKLINILVGLFFAIYILFSKERLSRQARKLNYALFKERRANYINHLASVAFKSFHGFFTGQFTEAVILGILFYVGMRIFKFPYAAMISVLTGFCQLIPIAGAWIGTIIGAILIAVQDPVKSLFFILFALIVQQFEGNVIYPKIVGESVGLPSMWVLFAITVGGNLMGLLGMLIFVPIVSICYRLLSEYSHAKLEEKDIKIEDKIPREDEGFPFDYNE